MSSVAANQRTLIVVTHDGGVKFSAQLRGHQVKTDQPVSAGGADSAPTPLELVGVALASCIALYVIQFCNARNIPSHGLRVELDQQTSKAPYRVSRYNIDLTLPLGFPAEYRAPLERVVKTCAVHNTLTHAPEIRVEY